MRLPSVSGVSAFARFGTLDHRQTKGHMETKESFRVLITAAASGIGRTVAETFLARGSRVFICDIAETHLEQISESLPGIGVSRADVADEHQIERLFEEATDFLGGLDVLVNNAGIAGPTAPVEEVSLEEWERTLAVNITGQFLCARRAVPLLREAGGGSIINMSSVAGRVSFPLRTPYSTSKWAVVGFTKTLATELGPYGIRVNAILPGVVESERMQAVVVAKAAALGVNPDQVEKEFVSTSSLGRKIRTSDIANMITFLCSSAGCSISGQAISVCGHVESLR